MPLTKVGKEGITGVSNSSDATAITIDSSEKVGIGTTAPEYTLQVNGANVSSGGGLATVCVIDTGTAYNGTNAGGGVTFRGKYNSSGNTTNFGTVQAIKENTTDGNYATALRFTTRANGGNLSERMRIDSSGRVLINTTSTVIDSDQVLQVSGFQACNMQSTLTNVDGGSVLNLKRSGQTQGDYIRLFNSGGSETGQIRVDSGGTTQFENVSDYRLKKNVKDWDVDASAKVKQIKIKTFDWKDQTTQTNGKNLVGVIAHELQEVYPHCVSGKKDGYGGDVDGDGNKKPMYQGVDYGKLTPLLTKALQEALARIDTLEAKVKALESK